MLNKPTGDMLNAAGSATPANLGTATAGTSTAYSRQDHVHAMPTAADVGAVTTTELANYVTTSQLGVLNGVAQLDGAGKLRTGQIPALTTSQIAQITPSGIGAASLTSGTLTTSQVAALTGDVTSTAGNPATTVVKLQGNSVSNASPSNGQALVWSGSAWAPATVSGGGGGGGANGLTYYLNQSTNPDSPTTGLPAGVKQLGRTAVASQTEITSGTLTQNVWTTLASFVSESTPIDPDVTSIPAGLWDYNIWAYGNANANAGTMIRVVASVYNGTTLTTLGTSSSQVINGISAQYSLSVLIPQTTIALTDRIFVSIEAMATAQGHSVTTQFGDSTPSHVHTSLPLVGGTGLWKTVNGNVQSPASLLIDADVASNAAIASSKIAGLAASATTDTTNASNITSGTLSTAQLATISGLPSGAQGSATVIPQLTVDNKGRVIALTTAQISALTSTGSSLTGSLAKFSSETAVTKAVAGTDYQGALTTSQPLALSLGGIGGSAASGIEALSLLGNSIFLVAVRHASNITPATYASPFTQMTYAAGAGVGGTATMDGYTIAQGDTILLINQTNNTQNGPWVISTLGTASVGAVLTRPVWFTAGNARNGTLCLVQYGLANTGFILALSGPLNTGSAISFGTSTITISQIWGRSTLATVSSNTYIARQTFAAGSTTGAPWGFQAGVLMTTPANHSAEWDGSQMYLTNASTQRRRVSYVDDIWTTVASPGATGTINFDTETQDVLSYLTAAQANWVINVRGNSTTTLNSLMAVGQSRTVVFMNTNGATAYAPTIQVDGVSQTVKWANGTSTGNASSTDMISITIVKTAATPTYSVFASIAKFA